MQPLETVHQHGTVLLIEDIPSDLDDAVRTQSQEVLVKRRMVELTEADAVANDRLPTGLSIRDDVSRFQQVAMPQAAEGTLLPVGLEDPFPKPPLMKSNPHF